VGHSLRMNYANYKADGSSSNAFSLQTATQVDTCLKPRESATFTRESSEAVERGGRLELSVYVLGGSCADGEGRHEVGIVNLDWSDASAARPTLYVVPTWNR
jgi:hypothetical protein